MNTYHELIARWKTDEGKPYKGKLIDWKAYGSDPEDIGCMCAQGQALHFMGGWTPEKLRDANQSEADAATAKLLGISRAHAILLRRINDQKDGAPAIVLTDPGKVIGDQWSKLLDFWVYLDSMTHNEWAVAEDAAWDAAWDAAGAAAGAAAGDAAGDAAGAAAGDAAGDAAGAAAGYAVRDAAWATAGAAAWEIQGANVLRNNKTPFYFLPFFGFASPEDIPPRPANYGHIHSTKEV